MDFHLRYRGPLSSNGSPTQKASIREQLSPQLEELFGTSRQLRDVAISWLRVASSMNNGIPKLEPPMPGLSTSPDMAPHQRPPEAQSFYRFPLGRYSFIPLVTRLHGLVCELDVTFLRREEPGAIVNQGGDIDNRLKTLFDALRIPYSAAEMGRPTDPGNPANVFCLLEDDLLVTRLGLRTGRLLGPLHVNGDQALDTDVELHIHAFIKVNKGTIENLDFM